MFRLNRNERSHWSGNGVHVEPESVFMISRNMQSQPTIRNMAEAMLVQLGNPVLCAGLLSTKQNRILNLIKEKQVRLIIVDELQHFIDRGRRRAPLEVFGLVEDTD